MTWSFWRSILTKGKTRRIITQGTAKIHWSFDGWKTVQDLNTTDTGLSCWFADLPSAKLQSEAHIVFIFF
jgi:hypothetical protein